MTESAKTDFQISATPGEELTRRLAYLATVDNGSVLTGGFSRDGGMLDREGNDRTRQQAANALEFLAHQERLRQERLAALASRFDALEQAARDTLTDAENDLADILSNANRDRDGRAVFRDSDGIIRDEDGQSVDPLNVDFSEWDPDGPSWEAYDQALSRRDQAAEIYERVVDAGSGLDRADLNAEQISSLSDELDALEAELVSFEEADNASAGHSASTLGDASLDEPPVAVSDFTLMTPGR